MTTVNMLEAKTQLSRLVEAVETGAETESSLRAMAVGWRGWWPWDPQRLDHGSASPRGRSSRPRASMATTMSLLMHLKVVRGEVAAGHARGTLGDHG
jgi:hypothetical protein